MADPRLSFDVLSVHASHEGPRGPAPANPSEPAQPVFYYDLASPACYLAAEQVMTALPVVPEWEPIRARSESVDRPLIEAKAAELGLQAVRWPQRWPIDSTAAMLAATYAKRIGRAVAFSLAAFRQTFAAGRDLADADTILLAAAACEMHPNAILKGIELRAVKEVLRQATQRAEAAGVRTLPAIEVAGSVFEGLEGLAAAAHMLAKAT